jgi:predicted ester cyclase
MKNFISAFAAISFLILGACASEKSEPVKTDFTERNKTSIIKANDELFNKGNLDFADEVFTENYAEKGPNFIKEYVGSMRTAFPDIHVSIDPIIAEGNKTAWQRTHTATHQGEFLGFQPSNKKITWTTTVISEYNDEGKVVKEWSTNDLFEVLEENKVE